LFVEGEEIRTTASHLFFTDSGWWKAAENLKVGDKIINSKGELKTLIVKSIETLNEPERIYNLNVDQFHTYFVGESRLLVHNNCTAEAMAYGRETIEKAKAQGVTDSATLSKIGTDAAADMQRAIENNITMAKKHGITDPVELEKITTDAANALRKPIGEVRGMYARTQAELDALALDPANGQMKLWERDAGLGCEADGQIAGPITRSTDPKADFIDINGKKWDVKSYRTDWQNGYDLNTAIDQIQDEIFNKGQNVIVDTSNLAKWAHDELVQEIITKGWAQYVRFYP
jgi:hypothetical protein